jgi:histidine triad (HIT) family protein
MGHDFKKAEDEGDCIFCKIISGQVPSVKIWEDEEHIAILDQFPTMEGQTLIITKEHFESYLFDMPRVAYKQLMLASKKVGKYLDKGMRAERVAMVGEGLGVNHAHVKLYPIAEGASEGYISTHQGPKKTIEELNKVAQKIKANS